MDSTSRTGPNASIWKSLSPSSTLNVFNRQPPSDFLENWWRGRHRTHTPTLVESLWVAYTTAVNWKIPQVGKISGPWLLEGVIVVVSVLLGFAVAQYGENRANKVLAKRALTGLQAELEHNLALVEPYAAFHRAYVDELEKTHAAAGHESGFEVFLKVRPELPRHSETDVPIPRRGAWEAAISSGALRFIDYDLIASLSEIYQMQDHVDAAIERIPVSGAAFFAPESRDAFRAFGPGGSE